jgi:hypothetical protein
MSDKQAIHEINTKINQSITESQDPELPQLATPGVEHY